MPLRHHNIDFVHKHGHLTPVEENLRHLRSFQEAVNIDANFAAEKDVSADRYCTPSFFSIYCSRE